MVLIEKKWPLVCRKLMRCDSMRLDATILQQINDSPDNIDLKSITRALKISYETVRCHYNRLKQERILGVDLRRRAGRRRTIGAEVDKVIAIL
jgi:hypothetical protein